MRFQVLGSMSLASGAETVVIGESQATVLLAALLLQPNELVTTAQLQRLLWETDPPANSRSIIHSYVTRLRRLFAKHGVANDAISSVVGGYRLPVTPATLDLVEFRTLVRQADQATDPEYEAAVLTRALELWRGEPVSNIAAGQLRQQIVAPLLEERLQATERFFDIALETDRCREVLPSLMSEAHSHPGHERLWEQLMEALYRVGRRADSITEYAALKGYLREEFGVDPGPQAQRLELAILRGELVGGNHAPGRQLAPAAVRAAAPASQPPAPVANRTLDPEPAPRSHPRPKPLRSELVENLVGRLEAGARAGLFAVLTGLPLVGKSRLAETVAARAAAEFGLPCDRIPGTVPAVASGTRWPGRSRAGGSILIVENVRSVSEIRSIVRSWPSHAVLVTSRFSLAGLAISSDVPVHRLGQLHPRDSIDLLKDGLGITSTSTRSYDLSGTAEQCLHYPPLLEMAVEQLLARSRVNGAVSDDGESGASAAQRFAAIGLLMEEHLDELSESARQAFRTLIDLPNHEFDVEACVVHLGLPVGRCASCIDELVDAHLLADCEDGRFRIPDILHVLTASGPVIR